MSSLTVKIHKNVDFSIPDDVEQEHAIISNEFSSILAPAIRRAWMLAHSLGHGQVLVEHFITALFAEEGARKILERNGYFDDDGERGQTLTKKRSGFGAPTFDQMSVSPGKLLPSPHLDAWFRAARDVARTREVEHVTLVVDDFTRALEPNFPFSDKELAAEIVESLTFVRVRLSQQSSAAASSPKVDVIGKIDEAVTELRGEAGAAYAVNAQAMELLANGLRQLGEKVDELSGRTSVAKSEIDARIFASNSERAREAEVMAASLYKLGLKVDDLNLSIPALKSEIDADLHASRSALLTEVQRLAEGLHQVGCKVDELNLTIPAVKSEIHADLHASGSALFTEVQRLAEGLHLVGCKVDELNLSTAAMRSESQESFLAAHSSRSSELELLAVELQRLGDKIDEFNPQISAVKSEVGANFSAMLKHHIDQAHGNLTFQLRTLQDSLADVHTITRKHLSASTNEARFGRSLSSLLPILAIIAGAGIGLIARMTFGPL